MREWFAHHHATAPELWVGFYKKSSGEASVSWPESVDVALCFGWIDGVRKNIDERSYKIRFTPRRSGSIWSAINTASVSRLIEAGLMRPEGLAAFEARTAAKSAIYSYERTTEPAFETAHLKLFRANKTAWSFFEQQPPGYRRTLTHWVTGAKREETRLSRLKALIEASERQTRMKRITLFTGLP